MQRIRDFLNQNPCLSEEWKNQLLSLISEDEKLAKDTTRINKDVSFYSRLREMIIRHEGVSHTVYRCTAGARTIGVGFNLDRPDAKLVLSNLGIPYPCTTLTYKQIDDLFDYSLDEAIKYTIKAVPSYDSQPMDVQLVLVNMMFNLGPTRFSAFKKMLEAVEKRDYITAAKEMVDSRWYSQVGNRSKELVELMDDVGRV
jgi:lysozyme